MKTNTSKEFEENSDQGMSYGSLQYTKIKKLNNLNGLIPNRMKQNKLKKNINMTLSLKRLKNK